MIILKFCLNNCESLRAIKINKHTLRNFKTIIYKIAVLKILLLLLVFCMFYDHSVNRKYLENSMQFLSHFPSEGKL